MAYGTQRNDLGVLGPRGAQFAAISPTITMIALLGLVKIRLDHPGKPRTLPKPWRSSGRAHGFAGAAAQRRVPCRGVRWGRRHGLLLPPRREVPDACDVVRIALAKSPGTPARRVGVPGCAQHTGLGREVAIGKRDGGKARLTCLVMAVVCLRQLHPAVRAMRTSEDTPLSLRDGVSISSGFREDARQHRLADRRLRPSRSASLDIRLCC
mmetsp:Transcript_41091/g.118175  ORF Transcript_41091/g.118175 Transcript_41091/m.118175 type:complete len:210 (+) Transcript_41091:977-1606(+)